MSGLRLVVLGLSITSSYGNGHATTYRGLLKAFAARGHSVLFLERDLPLYRGRRDMPDPDFCDVTLYDDASSIARFDDELAAADAILVGSYVKDGPQVIDHVLKTADAPVLFYDIDTPVTTTLLEKGACPYLDARQIPRFSAYLSFTGGPLLRSIEETYGAQRAQPLYCAVDPDVHHGQQDAEIQYDLGYLGTYSDDRQPGVDSLLLRPARALPDHRFAVAGPQYPEEIEWPPNVERREHIPPGEHAAFYTAQRFTLNVTRRAMRRWGYSPSVRLFEAAACGTPIISDRWNGIDTFFEPDEEIILASDPGEVIDLLEHVDDAARDAMGQKARRRVLRDHTAQVRAQSLEGYIHGCMAEHARREAPTEPMASRWQAPAQRQTDHAEDTVARLGPWFHNIRLPDGRQTAPDHPLGDFPAFKWHTVERMLPADLQGKRVLDVGCNGGFYTVEAARRGAHVTAIDIDRRYLEQTAWVAEAFGVRDRVDLHHAQVYELGLSDETYDIVLFLGVLYHLRYPLLALDMVRERTGDRLVFQTMQMPERQEAGPAAKDAPDHDPHARDADAPDHAARPKDDPGYLGMDALTDEDWPTLAFIEEKLIGDPTNWWVPNHAAVAAMLRSSGFEVMAHEDDIWSARPAPGKGVLRSWNRSELESILQRPWKDSLDGKLKPREGTFETLRASTSGHA